MIELQANHTNLRIELTANSLDDILHGMFYHDTRFADLLLIEHLHRVVPCLFWPVIPTNRDPVLLWASVREADRRSVENSPRRVQEKLTWHGRNS